MTVFPTVDPVMLEVPYFGTILNVSNGIAELRGHCCVQYCAAESKFYLKIISNLFSSKLSPETSHSQLFVIEMWEKKVACIRM